MSGTNKCQEERQLVKVSVKKGVSEQEEGGISQSPEIAGFGDRGGGGRHWGEREEKRSRLN